CLLIPKTAAGITSRNLNEARNQVLRICSIFSQNLRLNPLHQSTILLATNGLFTFVFAAQSTSSLRSRLAVRPGTGKSDITIEGSGLCPRLP
ncbi:MAG TPA: hypothetical protein VFT65_02015, partial [Candidatus Angelobacter sp.]|nr:hypothetical protein [Candidatus Angelobacter sp.]